MRITVSIDLYDHLQEELIQKSYSAPAASAPSFVTAMNAVPEPCVLLVDLDVDAAGVRYVSGALS